MTAKTADIISWFLCLLIWAACFQAARASEHDVVVNEGEYKLVTLSASNSPLSVRFENNNQSFQLTSPTFSNTPFYFVIKGAVKPQRIRFVVEKRYPETATLEYEFEVTEPENLDSYSGHDALSLSGLSLEQRAELLSHFTCHPESAIEILQNQVYLSAMEALFLLERFNDIVGVYKNLCADEDSVPNLQNALVRSYVALANLELHEIKSAVPLFESVISWYNAYDRNSIAISRAMWDISAHFGLTSTLYGRWYRSEEMSRKGRETLENAHRFFVENGFEVSTVYSLAFLWTVYAMARDYQQAFGALALSNQTIDSIAPDLVHQKTSNLNHRSLTYTFSGNTSAAIESMREAIDLNQGGKLNHRLSSIYFNLGSLYLQIGDYELAKKYYLSVKSYFEEHHADDAKGDINDGLGTIALDTGRYEDAKNYFNEALNYYKRNDNRTATMNFRLGYLATLQKNFTVAKSYFAKAGEHFGAEKVDYDNLNYYLRLARFYVAQGKIPESEKIMQKIEDYLQTLPDIEGMPAGTKSLLLPRQIDYLELKVDLFGLRGELQNQQENLEQLNQLIRSVSASLDTARSGPVWADYTSRIVTKYIETLHRAYIESGASESGKNLWLKAMYSAMETHMGYSTRRQREMSKTSDTLPREKSFLQQLYWSEVDKAEQALFSAQNDEQKLNAQLALNEAREKFRLSLNQFTVSEIALPSVPTLAETQALLNSNEVVLRFFELNKSLYRYVITSESWRMEEVGLTVQQVSQLIQGVNPEALSLRHTSLRNLAVLIPQDILDTSRFDKLIIVNEGANHYIPFAALNIAPDEYTYQALMQRFSLIMPFHLGTYLLGENSADSNESTITIFADPTFNDSAVSTVTQQLDTNEVKRSWLRDINALPATREEARSISKLLKRWNVNQLLQSDATNQALLSQRSRTSTILHIASHGYFNEQTPDVIGVATSVVDSSGEALSGFLSLRSMLAMSFTSKLIVISGCETGMGQELKGEGLVSLARGLIGQGAGGVISTLWEIPDRPTALFMRFFYEGLLNKQGDVPAALAYAQMTLMQTGRYRNPRYWAGFTYTGGSRADSIIAMQ